MNISQAQAAIFIFLVVWLALLTVWQLRLRGFFSQIFFHKGKDLVDSLESILQKDSHYQKSLAVLEQKLLSIEEESISHYQKIGLVKFNPFPDTGGTQSFAMALLDKKNDGIVIVNLHSREESRLYAKQVKNGQGTQLPLSKEELQAVRLANKPTE